MLFSSFGSCNHSLDILYWPESYIIPSGLFNPIQIVWSPSWSCISHWHWKNPHHKAGCGLICFWLWGLLCYFTSLSSVVILGKKSKIWTKTLLLNHILGGVSWIRVRVDVNSICSSRSCPGLEMWVLCGRVGWGSSLRFPLAVLTENSILVVLIARCCELLPPFFAVESVHSLANPSLRQRTC